VVGAEAPWGWGPRPPKKIRNPWKKIIFLRVSYVMVLTKMKFNPHPQKRRNYSTSTRVRSRIEDEFLADHLLVYIEKEIAKDFTTEMIINEFYFMKDSCWAQFVGYTKLFFGFFFFFFTCL